MKEEIMKVLELLEKGVINAEDADKLIKTINNEKDCKVGETISDTLNKVGDGITKFAKTVGEKAEKAAEKAEPYVKKMGEKAGDAAEDIVEKAKNINFGKKDKTEESIDVEATEVCAEDDSDFVKDVNIVTMPESQSFSSNETVEKEEKIEE